MDTKGPKVVKIWRVKSPTRVWTWISLDMKSNIRIFTSDIYEPRQMFPTL